MNDESPDLDPTHIFEAVEFPDAYRISYLANAIVFPTYDDVLRDFGLFRVEYHLLMCLAHYPVLASRDVAQLTRMPRNTISRAVKRMEVEGFITRTENPDDRRKSKLKITPNGKVMHEKIAAYLVAREAEVLDVLGDEERQHLKALLQKLTHHAAKLDR